MNFLRDFADANADSFAPEQIEHLNRASVEIAVLDKAVDNLIKEREDAFKQIDALISERDSARWEVCELSGNGSIDSAVRVAEERGWNLTEDDDNFGYDPHAEAWAARAEEGKKIQEEYRKRHEERMARIAATRKNAEGTHNPPF